MNKSPKNLFSLVNNNLFFVYETRGRGVGENNWAVKISTFYLSEERIDGDYFSIVIITQSVKRVIGERERKRMS